VTGLYIIGGTVAFVLGAVIWLDYRAGKRGEDRAELRNLDKGIQGLDAARRARDDARSDTDARELRRDKYRAR